MIWTLVAVQWVLAGLVVASAGVVAYRGRPDVPWVELGLVVVALTNLATITPALLADGREPPRWLLATAMAAWLVVLFTFPDGRPAPAWSVRALAVGLAGVGASLLVPDGGPVLAIVFVSAFSVGVGAQVWRFQRRSTVAERQATKWLLAGLVPAAAMFVGVGLVVSTTSLDDAVLGQPSYEALSTTAIWLVPVAAATGLLFADRAPVDEVLQAVLVACGLAVAIGWAYFAIEPLVGPTWSAAAAVALVLPVHAGLQRLATRVVYARGHASPIVLLDDRLATSVREQDVAEVVARTVADALAVPHVAVVLGGTVAASTGERPPDDSRASAPEVFPVPYLGKEVAEIVVTPRTGDRTLAERDRQDLVRLSTSAGAALHGAATLRELSLAREQLVLSREEERRRLRRDLHDDLAPTLAGLGMRTAAATSLASVDPRQAKELYDEVQAGIHAAIAQVREIAYDLRPPMLDDLGLEAAVRDRLATGFDPFLDVELEVHDLPADLPAAVELAALRIVQEAVTNVRKHAEASTCRVILAGRDDRLEVVIRDDGVGLPAGHLRGVGLRSIDERAAELGGRCTITSDNASGTTVTVVLPTRKATPP